MSAIDDKYAQLGGPGGFLGRPFDAGAGSGEMDTADRRGRFRDFERGTIYWTAATGAHEVHGDIRLKWVRVGGGRSFLGYPLTDETGTPNRRGRFNHFEHGSISGHPRPELTRYMAPFATSGPASGWERSRLGFPTSDEKAVPNSGDASASSRAASSSGRRKAVHKSACASITV